MFEHSFVVDADVKRTRAFHGSPAVLRQLTPPPVYVQVHDMSDVADGMVADLTMWLGPIPQRWKAEHLDVSERGFTDVQRQGPLRSWRHTHRFEPGAEGRTTVHDHVEYEHHGGLRGLWTRLNFNRVSLGLLFWYRALVTRRALRTAR